MRDYELIRSDRRSLSLGIRDGRPLVRAPRRLPKSEIDKFVAAHEDWIIKQLEKARPMQNEISPEEEKRLRAAAREYLPGSADRYIHIDVLLPVFHADPSLLCLEIPDFRLAGKIAIFHHAYDTPDNPDFPELL